MLGWLLRLVAHLTAGVLAALAARRAVFMAAAAWPTRETRSVAGQPALLVVLAARNEETCVGRALDALDRTDYPRDRLQILLVDDCSTDATLELLQAHAETRPHVRVTVRAGSPNKAAALNCAVADSHAYDLLVVCDADQEPASDCFRHLAAAFDDPEVGAAAAYLRPANADASLVSRYTAVETWVHQLVTSAAKDRLGLDPPMLGGGSMYRREALAAIGGFPEWVFSEDLGSSLLLTRAGWRTRFVRRAEVANWVAAGWLGYWNQHQRWTRSFYQSARPAPVPVELPARTRIEQALQHAGYLDRVALAGALVLVASRRMAAAVPGAYAGVVAAEIVLAVARAGAGRRLPRFLLATAVVFPLDALGALVATASHLARRPLDWRSPRS
jgi:cellulose synthase/poly-beta-1,6-N-acetylglucosamine synthase-like glycosyltransferase